MLKKIKESHSGLSYDKWKYVTDEQIDWLIDQAAKTERYEKALNDIVNPQMDQWLKYNEKHGGQISFQEFLKDIARNGLMKE